MPAVSQAQQEAAGADLRRMRAGLAPRTFKGISMDKLRHFAATKRSGLPPRARVARAKARMDMSRSRSRSGSTLHRSVSAARSARASRY